MIKVVSFLKQMSCDVIKGFVYSKEREGERERERERREEESEETSFASNAITAETNSGGSHNTKLWEGHLFARTGAAKDESTRPAMML